MIVPLYLMRKFITRRKSLKYKLLGIISDRIKMMIETLISMVRYLSPKQDDDATDRLHYLYTANILLAFAVLISFKQFGGRPLECMFPNKFPGSWEQVCLMYTHTFYGLSLFFF